MKAHLRVTLTWIPRQRDKSNEETILVHEGVLNDLFEPFCGMKKNSCKTENVGYIW